jgi:biotin carboxyl carrier protein
VSAPAVRRIGEGVFAVEIDGRREIVYAARTAAGRVACCQGELFQQSRIGGRRQGAAEAGPHHPASALPITAPMPATVMKVLVSPGAAVRKGDTLVILEAMKMELPLRASADGTVTAVHCRDGELVQPDALLIELT